jgi:hypothetical protein
VFVRLSDRVDNPVPDCSADGVATRREIFGSLGAFHHGLVAITLQHQGGDATNVDLRLLREVVAAARRIPLGVPSFARGAGGALLGPTPGGGRRDGDPDAHRNALLADARGGERSSGSRRPGAALAIHLSIANIARVVHAIIRVMAPIAPQSSRIGSAGPRSC